MSMQQPASRRRFFGKLMTNCVRSFEHGQAGLVFGEQAYTLLGDAPTAEQPLICTPRQAPLEAIIPTALFNRLPNSFAGAATHFNGARLTVISLQAERDWQDVQKLVLINPPADYIAPCPVLLVFDAATQGSAAMGLVQLNRQPTGSDVFYGSLDWYEGSPLAKRVELFAKFHT